MHEFDSTVGVAAAGVALVAAKTAAAGLFAGSVPLSAAGYGGGSECSGCCVG